MVGVFLDFDGVLIDSVGEVSFSTHAILKDRFGAPLSNAVSLFEKYRYLAGPAWHFYYLYQSVVESAKQQRSIVELFHELLPDKRQDDDVQFEQKLFANREALDGAGKKLWLSLHREYPFTQFVKEYLLKEKMYQIFIVSTKNKQSLSDLCNHFNIEIPEERIFGFEAYEQFDSKKALIDNVMDENKITDALFIDDATMHIEYPTYVKGLQCVQNDWGYVDPDNGSVVSFDQVKKTLTL